MPRICSTNAMDEGLSNTCPVGPITRLWGFWLAEVTGTPALRQPSSQRSARPAGPCSRPREGSSSRARSSRVGAWNGFRKVNVSRQTRNDVTRLDAPHARPLNDGPSGTGNAASGGQGGTLGPLAWELDAERPPGLLRSGLCGFSSSFSDFHLGSWVAFNIPAWTRLAASGELETCLPVRAEFSPDPQATRLRLQSAPLWRLDRSGWIRPVSS